MANRLSVGGTYGYLDGIPLYEYKLELILTLDYKLYKLPFISAKALRYETAGYTSAVE
jgi:hypothetical protein